MAVVVVKNPPVDFDQTSYTSTRPYNPIQPETNYITAAWNENDVRAGQVPNSFNVGDGMMKIVGSMTYINANLDSNTDYAVFVRFDIAADDNMNTLYVYSETLVTKTGQFLKMHLLYVFYTCFFFYSSSSI